MKFLFEVYEVIRIQVGERFPIGIKLNSADYQRGGFSEDKSLYVLEKLAMIGIDLVEISGGNYENPMMFWYERKSTKEREAYFLDYAKKSPYTY